MTKTFAISEATRRTEVLGTTHYVLQSRADGDEYIVTTTRYANHNVIATIEFVASAQPSPTISTTTQPRLTNVEAAAVKLGNSIAETSKSDLLEFTFHNVEIHISAKTPELAYTALCNALAGIDADWTTDNYTLPNWTGSNRDRIDVSTLYPKD